jgi:2-oxoglutarate dehydrogenase E2 component (dihydrolipoamide succinyltransferase)
MDALESRRFPNRIAPMATLTDIVLPADQTEGTTNVVGKWFKAVGDRVAANEPLLEITTDKVTVEIAAPEDGVLLEILKAEGENVEQGDVLGRVGQGTGGVSPAPPPEPLAQSDGTSRAAVETTGAETELSPAVRRLLKEHRIDPAEVKGSGRGGRITAPDVEAYLAARATTKPARGGGGGGGGGGGRMIPHSPMRKSIAAHMVQSVATAPHVTSVFEVDLSQVIRHRAGHQPKPTFTAYFVRASVAALQAVPEVNGRWHDDGLELFDDCNVGIGTALPDGGLIVPVVKQAQRLDLDETAARLQDLTTRARAGTLTPKEVQDGTFTISNHGVSGSLVAAPIIINQPQSAILGVGKVEQRAVVIDGRIEARPRCYVTLTIDHRVLDGFQANAFLTKWVETIERWPA